MWVKMRVGVRLSMGEVEYGCDGDGECECGCEGECMRMSVRMSIIFCLQIVRVTNSVHNSSRNCQL